MQTFALVALFCGLIAHASSAPLSEKKRIELDVVRRNFQGSSHVEVIDDVDCANRPSTFHAASLNLSRNVLDLDEFSNSALTARVKTKPPARPVPFAFVAAVSGDDYVLKSMASFCALHHFQSKKRPMFMAVSNIDPAAKELLKLIGVTPIELAWKQPVPYIRWETVQSRGPGFPRMFKTNLFGLEKFFQFGLFLDADVFFKQDIEDVISRHLQRKTAFIANKHEREHCVTTNVMFFRSSIRRFRRIAMRSYTGNANRTCSGDDQMIISAEFEPYGGKYSTFLSDETHRREVHWQGERDQLVDLAQRVGLTDQVAPSACANYWNKVLMSSLLQPDSFKCRERGCMTKLVELLQEDA